MTEGKLGDLTEINIREDQKRSAITSAYRITMSEHEWSWTQRDQEEMALMILWQATENTKLTERLRIAESVIDALKKTKVLWGVC